MSLVVRRFVVLSTAALGFMFGPMAMAQQSASPRYLPITLETYEPASVVVESGDHLWSISAAHLEDQLAHSPSATEIAPYWREVIDANRDRLRSGDPDLIYPGETVLLPETG